MKKGLGQAETRLFAYVQMRGLQKIRAGELTALRRQVEAELRPVLRDRDFSEFDLDRAFEIAVRMAEAVQER